MQQCAGKTKVEGDQIGVMVMGRPPQGTFKTGTVCAMHMKNHEIQAVLWNTWDGQ